MEPKIGPNPAAAMPMPHNTFPTVSMTASAANAIMNMPSIKNAAGCDRSCCTKPVRDVAGERRKRAHHQQCQCIGEGPQLAPNVEVGCNWLLEDTEALARTDPDREDQGPADYSDPEAAS